MSENHKIEADSQPVEWLTRQQFAERNPGVSFWLIGDLVRRGELDSVRLGRRLLIPSNALELLAERQRSEREAARNGGGG